MEYIDSERLILEVKHHPCLYNVKNKDFKNRELKRFALKTVTMNVVGGQWEEMDENSKDEIGKLCYYNFYNLRQFYLKINHKKV